jgi:hypothetical protein
MPIDAKRLAVVRVLCERLSALPRAWALTGSAGLALRGIDVAVRDVDVRTDREGAHAIARAFAEAVERPVTFASSETIRSHFGSLRIEGVPVEIMGDMQQRLEDGAWEDPGEWQRHVERVEVDGLAVPVLGLAYERDMYARLGRADKVESVRRALERRSATDASFEEPSGEDSP